MDKFEAGKTYSAKSVCDHDAVFTFEVLSRTAKTVTLKTDYNETVTRKISIQDNKEYCRPNGNYSMAVILRA